MQRHHFLVRWNAFVYRVVCISSSKFIPVVDMTLNASKDCHSTLIMIIQHNVNITTF